MARPKRNQQIDLQNAIKDTAWEQIATCGAPALSLRSIARSLHITAPAIYNYYPRRDDLVTALIIDAYTEFGEQQLQAYAAQPAGDYKAQLRATGLAYRQWALAHPQRYQLIFGASIPGYVAPPEKVAPVGARALQALIQALENARTAGGLNLANLPVLSAQLRSQLETWQHGYPLSDVLVLYLALVVWSRVHGLMMLEIGGQCPPFVDPGEIYRLELESIVQQYFQ